MDTLKSCQCKRCHKCRHKLYMREYRRIKKFYFLLWSVYEADMAGPKGTRIFNSRFFKRIQWKER